MPIIAVGFPGAYKFFVIYFLSFFAVQNIADFFSQGYFWVAFLVTFSGIPFSSIVMGKNTNISIVQLIIGIVLSSLFIIIFSYYIKLHTYSTYYILILFSSLVFMSMYEVLKTRLLNTGKFNEVVISSLITVFIFLTAFLLNASKELLIFVFFLALLIPISVIFYLSDLNHNSYFENKITLFKAYLNFTLSNALSTSIMAFLPLFLINELGENVSLEVAQVFTFSTLLYLFPRVMLAKRLPVIRTSNKSTREVLTLFNNISRLVFCAVAFATLLFYLFAESSSLTYLLLFSGIIISQLNLPFSTLLIINSNSKTTLIINLISSIYFISLVAICFYYVEQGYDRANLILLAFIVFQMIKLFLNYKKTIGFKIKLKRGN